MNEQPVSCPACGAPISGEPSACPFCGFGLPKSQPPAVPSVQIPGQERVQPVKPPEPPKKPVDAVPEWLADDAEELAAKYDSRDQGTRATAQRAQEISRQAAQASLAAQEAAKRGRKGLGWGCLGGCLTFGVLLFGCMVMAFVIEQVLLPGQWGSGESPFVILAIILPLLAGFGVMALIAFLIRRKR